MGLTCSVWLWGLVSCHTLGVHQFPFVGSGDVAPYHTGSGSDTHPHTGRSHAAWSSPSPSSHQGRTGGRHLIRSSCSGVKDIDWRGCCHVVAGLRGSCRGWGWDVWTEILWRVVGGGKTGVVAGSWSPTVRDSCQRENGLKINHLEALCPN